ncbi:MAG: glutathione S-transferase family protein [Fimbriimonadaceae bacterium]|nr:glutathione S-transferase family protein [Alphaproteobacteria bacterium]
MSKLEIIGFAASTYTRSARIACVEKGIDHDLVPGSITSLADIRGAEHMKLHPFGRIPVLRHGDKIVFETSAICYYIDHHFEGPDLTPKDPDQWIDQEQWVSAVNFYLDHWMVRECVIQYAFPSGPGGQPDRTRIDAALPEIKLGIAGLAGAFANGPFIGGARPMIADFLLIPMIDYFANVPEGPEMLKDAPYLHDFRAAFAKRPSYRSTLPEHLKEATE